MSDIAVDLTSDHAPLAQRRRRTVRKTRTDGRTKLGRRAAQLLADYTRRLGGVTPASDPTIYAAAVRLAELETLAESQRASAIRGDAVDMVGLIRLENVARRMKLDLGLAGPPPPPPLPTLDELLGDEDDAGA
jgi:hypothetical protein